MESLHSSIVPSLQGVWKDGLLCILSFPFPFGETVVSPLSLDIDSEAGYSAKRVGSIHFP